MNSIEEKVEGGNEKPKPRSEYYLLALGALGVVFGDIGTSPLYAIRECFYGEHAIPVTPLNVLGVLSLVFWSLICIISFKYISYIMRADNRGEGGVLALMALAHQGDGNKKNLIIIVLGLIGATLFYGDSMITPAISVLSAVEGLEVVTPVFKPFVVPITVVILIGLFSAQAKGTGQIGKIFGPIMLIWFFSIGLAGLSKVILEPSVLWAMNPVLGLRFLMEEGFRSLIVLGSVFLVVTGGEALFADIGHFGRAPIAICWKVLVFPALLLNYFGQGALLLENPKHAINPFFHLLPQNLIFPMVILATVSTVIASQAVISGAFSMTQQAISLGYLPRLPISHTSSDIKGQIYIGPLNWVLCVFAIGLVVATQSSSKLASAYGMAVSLTMIITTILTFMVARRIWKWNLLAAGSVLIFFIVIDFAYLSANTIKIPHGGWFPLLMAAFLFTLMTTWGRGREVLAIRLRERLRPLEKFVQQIKDENPTRVPGTAIFMMRSTEGTPPAIIHNLKHNKVVHERVVVLSIVMGDVPHVPVSERLDIEELGAGFYRVLAHFGFMDSPDVQLLLESLRYRGLKIEMDELTFFLGRETLLATTKPGMAIWREKLFAFMSRNAQSAMEFFKIPPDRVVEIGLQVEL